MFINHIYLIYMYKQDLALDHQQWLICYKPQPTKLETLHIHPGSSSTTEIIKHICNSADSRLVTNSYNAIISPFVKKEYEKSLKAVNTILNHNKTKKNAPEVEMLYILKINKIKNNPPTHTHSKKFLTW